MQIKLTYSRLRTLFALGFGQSKSASQLAKEIDMELPNFISDVIDPLLSAGIISYGDSRRNGRAGRPPRLLQLSNDQYILHDICDELEHKLIDYEAKTSKLDWECEKGLFKKLGDLIADEVVNGKDVADQEKKVHAKHRTALVDRESYKEKRDRYKFWLYHFTIERLLASGMRDFSEIVEEVSHVIKANCSSSDVEFHVQQWRKIKERSDEVMKLERDQAVLQKIRRSLSGDGTEKTEEIAKATGYSLEAILTMKMRMKIMNQVSHRAKPPSPRFLSDDDL